MTTGEILKPFRSAWRGSGFAGLSGFAQQEKPDNPADPLALLPYAIRHFALHALLFIPSPHEKVDRRPESAGGSSRSESESLDTAPLPQRSHMLASPEAPKGRELRLSGGAERVGLVGCAGMIRTDIDLADHSEPRFLKGGE